MMKRKNGYGKLWKRRGEIPANVNPQTEKKIWNKKNSSIKKFFIICKVGIKERRKNL